MNHRHNALLNFLSCEFSQSAEEAKRLLTEKNLANACRIDSYSNTEILKTVIYASYKDFGMDHARGVFEVTVVEAFNSQQ